MKIISKDDEKLVVEHVQYRWTVYIFIVSLFGLWALVNPSLMHPSFNFQDRFNIKDLLYLGFVGFYYLLKGPSSFVTTTLVEFDKKMGAMTISKQRWLKGKKNVYPLGDIQAVKYREEEKKSYMALRFPFRNERSIYQGAPTLKKSKKMNMFKS